MKRLYSITTVLLLFFSICLSAQVTIGTNEKPAPGALLQLKALNDITNGGANSNEGLMLPRVSLENETDLYPMFNDQKEAYLADKENIDNAHTGLLVYNLANLKLVFEVPATACEPAIITTKGNIIPGLAIWNGTKWENLITEEESDTTDGMQIADNIFTFADHEGNYYLYREFGNAGFWMTTSLATKTAPPSINSQLTYSLWSANLSETANTQTAIYGYPRKEENQTITDPQDFNEYPNAGLLYSRGAVTGGLPVQTGMQGICPDGWHIPSADEYQALVQEIKDNYTKYTSATSDNFLPSEGLVTQCGVFGFPGNAVSLSAPLGGFALLMTPWASGYSGTVANNLALELVCINGGNLAFMTGVCDPATLEIFPELGEFSPSVWGYSNMISLRCKKN